MKKLIVAVALFVSSAVNAGQMFGNWEVDYKQSRISSETVEPKWTSLFTFGKPGYFAVFAYEHNLNGGGFDVKDVVSTKETVVSVNGTNVKMQLDMTHEGVIRLITVTKRGNDYVTNEFWSKRKVNFIMNGNSFTISAQGVQSAWRTLNSGYAI